MRRSPDEPVRRTRLMFLAWGYSIHAARRIRVFVDDPAFEVAVVSTHDYAFPGARNYLLAENGAGPGRLARAALTKLRARVTGLVPQLMHDVAVGTRDLAILKRAVEEFRPDAVFLQTLLYPCYLAYALPRSLPLIVTFWNGDVTWWAEWNGIERLLKKRIVTHGVRRAAAVTVNSRTAVEACSRYGGDPDRIHLIRYPGVDLARFRPSPRASAREALGITAGRVVFCPRGLGGYLNSDVIVAAIARVASRDEDVAFVFASGAGGEGELERHRELARQLGVARYCRWEGQVPWERMPEYYAASDVMVSISSNDSLPNCMLEAMACGVPLVMGDIPQIREWITDGETGFLVPCRDAAALAAAVCRVFDSEPLARRFGERNLETVRAQADGRRNNEQIKDLVRKCAGARSSSDEAAQDEDP